MNITLAKRIIGEGLFLYGLWLPEPRIGVTADGTIFLLLRDGREEMDEAELFWKNRRSDEPLDLMFF